MAHGSRGRWLHAATGFGVMLCTALIGCQNTDQSKDKAATKLPGQGLYGTPTLPNNSANKMQSSGLQNGQQNGQFAGSNLIQTGATGQPGSNVQPANFVTPPSNSFQRPPSGNNWLQSGPQQQPNFPAQPGAGSQITPPAQTGIQQPQPPAPPSGGGFGMANPLPTNSGLASGNTPPPPSLALDGSIPPPSTSSAPSVRPGGSLGNDYVPIAPGSPPGGIPPTIAPPLSSPSYRQP
jgi:hypothetical protein